MQLAAPPPTAFSTLPHSDVVDVTRKAASPRRRVWHPRRSAACRAGFHPAWGCTTTSSHRIPTPPHHRAWFRADAGATKTLLVQLKHLTRRFDRSRVEHSCAAMPTWRAVLHRNVWSDGAGSSPHLHGRLGLHRKDRSWGHMSQACGQQPSAVWGGGAFYFALAGRIANAANAAAWGHSTLLSWLASLLLPWLQRRGILLHSRVSHRRRRHFRVQAFYFALVCRIAAFADAAAGGHSTLLSCVASSPPPLRRRVSPRRHCRCRVEVFYLLSCAASPLLLMPRGFILLCSPVPHCRYRRRCRVGTVYVAFACRIAANVAIAVWGQSALLSFIAPPLLPPLSYAGILLCSHASHRRHHRCRVGACDSALACRIAAAADGAAGFLPCSRVSHRRCRCCRVGAVQCSWVSQRRCCLGAFTMLSCVASSFAAASRCALTCYVATAATSRHITMLWCLASPPPLPPCGSISPYLCVSRSCRRRCHLGASHCALICCIAASAIAVCVWGASLHTLQSPHGGISRCSQVSRRRLRRCYGGNLALLVCVASPPPPLPYGGVSPGLSRRLGVTHADHV